MWPRAQGVTLHATDQLSRLLALPRLGAQRGVLAAVLGSILLATTLVAVGPILTTAVAEAGLRASLGQAQPTEIGVEVELRTDVRRAEDAALATLDAVLDVLGDRVAPPDVTVEAGTVHLSGQPPEVVTPVRVRVPWQDDRVEPAPRLYGEASSAAADDASGVPALLDARAAAELGLAAGDVAAVDDGAAVVVTGLVAPVDAEDRRWWDDALGRRGVVPGVDFTRVGPLLLDALEDVPAVVGDDRVAVTVRTEPLLDRTTPASLRALGRDARRLEERVDRLLTAGPGDPLADQHRVLVPLADATADATVALAATRAAVTAAVGQVAVLALYTLGLAGRLLRSGRDVETLLVRARGATPRQLGRAAFAEGLVLVVPSVLLGPWLAAAAVTALGRLPVVARADLVLAPDVGFGALLASSLAGVACLVVLVWPAVTSARRTYAGTRGGRGRRSPVGWAQQHGLDLALVAVAGIGVWQLRVQRSVLGTVAPRDPGDVDPVLVVAPALGLLAGALLVLRLVPVLARAGDRVAARVQGLVAGLGGWQVARRPDATARPLLLLVLAVAVGVLASTYDLTWRTSQQEQAAAAVGADLALTPDQRPVGLPARDTAGVLEALPGVVTASPLVVTPIQLVAAAPGGTLVALDAGDPLLDPRDDLAPSVPFATLDVAGPAGLALPAGDELVLPTTLAPDPAWPALAVDVTLVLRDGHGLVHRLDDVEVPATGAPVRATWSLADVTAPVEVLALEVTLETGDADGSGYRGELVVPPAPPGFDPPDGFEFPAQPLPPQVALAVGAPRVDGVAAPLDDVGWVPDPLASGALLPATLDDVRTDGAGWEVDATAGLANQRGRLAVVRLVAAPAVDPPAASVPALVHPDVLAATGADVGDEVSLAVGNAPLRLALVGTVPLVPGELGARAPVVVDLDALATARWTALRVPTAPTAWQARLAPEVADDLDAVGALVGAVEAAPVAAPEVRAAALDGASRSRDPIAVGLLAALTLGAVAAVVLALLGTVATAVVGVRERAAELALLQAVGVTLRQLGWWLAIEVALVVVLGLAAGGALGALLVWAVLPTIGLATDGTVAVPPPVVVVPWRTLLAAGGAVVGAFAVVPLVLVRVVARAEVAEALRLGEDG